MQLEMMPLASFNVHQLCLALERQDGIAEAGSCYEWHRGQVGITVRNGDRA